MTSYLARLKARSGQKRLLDEPSKPSKPSFEGFEGYPGGHFPRAAVGAAAAPPANFSDAADGWTNAHEERAAIIEHDGGALREWAEGLARLDCARPPGDVPERRWRQFINDSAAFLDGGWPAKAQALGWSTADLFGADRHKPWAGFDRQGLLWLLNGRRLVALTADSATIETVSGSRLTYRRVPRNEGQVLAWELDTCRLMSGGASVATSGETSP